MSLLDKITGRLKKTAGEVADDAHLREQGRKEERKGEVKDEAARAKEAAREKQAEADRLEAQT